MTELTKEQKLYEIKEIAYRAWIAAANAYRMYPENKHTFGAYWTYAEERYLLDLKIADIEKYISSLESDIGFMGSLEYNDKKEELIFLKKKRENI